MRALEFWLLITLEVTPTNACPSPILEGEGYRLKVSINTELNF